jgi:hypothetical protein
LLAPPPSQGGFAWKCGKKRRENKGITPPNLIYGLDVESSLVGNINFREEDYYYFWNIIERFSKGDS